MIHTYKKGKAVKLSEHFKSTDFDCKCKYKNCTITYIDSDLVDYLEKKMSKLGHPLNINSGFRCTAHNRDVGGKKGSYHLIGKAADLLGENPKNFEDADGLGVYPGKRFIHVDKRGYKSRWVG